jgi:putative oxidoreductase
MSTTYQKCSWAYGNFVTVAAALRSPLLLAIRLYWGFQFMQTGWGKLQHLERVTGYFATLGIPFPHANAIFVSGLEFVGGILLILGLGSRLVALLLTGNMVVAYLTADRAALLAIFSDPAKFFGADPFTFLFASLLILVLGPGAASIDALIARINRHAISCQQGPTIEHTRPSQRESELHRDEIAAGLKRR